VIAHLHINYMSPLELITVPGMLWNWMVQCCCLWALAQSSILSQTGQVQWRRTHVHCLGRGCRLHMCHVSATHETYMWHQFNTTGILCDKAIHTSIKGHSHNFSVAVLYLEGHLPWR